MAKYGMPYMGSKDKIADQIINVLPRGNRLVDLFGGGGAITHCASLSGKWDTVHYNELNKLCYSLLVDAVAGKFSYDIFIPEWITREKFFELCDVNGYVNYIWSFGNKGKIGRYVFAKEMEDFKRIVHNCVVFNDFSEINTILPDFKKFPDNCIGIKSRRLFFSGIIRNEIINNNFNLEHIDMLQQLQQLHQLSQIERLQQLERIGYFTHSNLSYVDVELKYGDIVYCDPPYAKTTAYSTDGFNNNEFWYWVRNCKHPVYISEYNAPNDMIKIGVMNKMIGLSFNADGGRTFKEENIYWNGVGDNHSGGLF